MKRYIIYFIITFIAFCVSILTIRQTRCFVLQEIAYENYNIRYPECLVPFVKNGKINFLQTKKTGDAIVFDTKYFTDLGIIEKKLSSDPEYIDVKRNPFTFKGKEGEYVIFIKDDRQSIAFIDLGSTKYTLGYVGKYENFDHYLTLLSRFKINERNK